ncbi:MAG: filamentous hemagglutinin N-terminal domain-containing protein [Symploca sp. SIO3E6]|nr:filamentous hemagglutinin N-terminal domain-containing protein [Caldora sp. SIO3E6]
MKLTKAQKNLVLEYARLAARSELSELEAERMGEILELAESDDLLSILINEVDYFVFQELNLLDEDSIYHYENQKARIKEFIEPRLTVEQDEYIAVGAEIKRSTEEPQAVVGVSEFKVRKQKAHSKLIGTMLGVLAVVGVGGFSYYSNLGELRNLISDTDQEGVLTDNSTESVKLNSIDNEKGAQRTSNEQRTITSVTPTNQAIPSTESLETDSMGNLELIPRQMIVQNEGKATINEGNHTIELTPNNGVIDTTNGILNSLTIANNDSSGSILFNSPREIVIDDIDNSEIINDRDTITKTATQDGKSDTAATDIATIDSSIKENIAIQEQQLIVQDEAIVQDIQPGDTGNSVNIFDVTGTEFDSFSRVTIGQADSSLDFSISQQVTVRSLLGSDSINLTEETLTVKNIEPLTLPDNQDIAIGNMNSSYAGDGVNITFLSEATIDAQTPIALFANSSSSEDAGDLIIYTNRIVVKEGNIAASPNEELSTDETTAPRNTRNTASIGSGILTPSLIEGGQAIVAVASFDVSLIKGGALRGSNRFHSFSEFNVEELQRVYFANSTGIENIISRVTESNPSNILGALGVEDKVEFPSTIFSHVAPGTEGNLEGLELITASLELTNGSDINTSTLGIGDSLEITATDLVQLDGESNDGSSLSGIFAQSASGAEGNSGGIELTTSSLELTNGASVSASNPGVGDSGTVKITATNSVRLDEESSDRFSSGIFSQVNSGAEGNSEGIELTTSSLELINGARVSASTFGVGDSGTVKITATNSVQLDGESNDGSSRSGISSMVESGAEGNSEGIEIETASLQLTNGAIVSAYTFGIGNAGNISVRNAQSIFLDNNSFIATAVETTSLGTGGDINIQTRSLFSENNSRISARSRALAGNINIDVSDTLTATDSDITTSVFSGADNGGNITITTDSLIAFDDSDIFAFASDGRGGDITFKTPVFSTEFDIDDTVGIKQFNVDFSQELYQILFATDEPGEGDKQ